jgi:hypothetical protein
MKGANEMAIRHFVSKREDVPADAVNVQDASDSYRPQPDTPEKLAKDAEQGYSCGWTPERCAAFTLFTYDTHVGLCIHEREANGYHDSDFYMLVWNEEKQAAEEIEFASTRGWCQPCFGSHPDATPEVMAKYEAWRNEVARKARINRDIEQASLPKWGREVRIIKGRKHPLGLTGDVFWTSDPVRSRYNPFSMPKAERIGVRLVDGSRIFIAASNLEVVNPDRYREHKEEMVNS